MWVERDVWLRRFDVRKEESEGGGNRHSRIALSRQQLLGLDLGGGVGQGEALGANGTSATGREPMEAVR